MKKKLFLAAVLLAALATGYTAWAYFSTRGVAVYLLGTRMGAILAGSWQWTLLAAVLLWIPGAAVLVRRLRRRGQKAAPAAKSAPDVPPAVPSGSRIPPRKGTVGTGTGTIPPKAPQQPPVQPAPAADAGATAVLPSAAATEVLPPEEDATQILPPEGEATEILPPEADATQVLPPEGEPTQPLPSAEPPAPAAGQEDGAVCPVCGNRVSGGRFCTRCGAKLRD